MPELNLEFEIPVTKRSLRRALCVALVTGLAGDLASESVTLTTFYPAPSGVYTQLVASQNVYLARDANPNVGGATPPVSPSSLVEVGAYVTPPAASPYNTRLLVNGGFVGIGTTSLSPQGAPYVNSTGPGCPLGACPRLQIFEPTGNTTVDMMVNGRVLLGDPVTLTAMWGGICLNTTCTAVAGYAKSLDGSLNFGLMNTASVGPIGLFMSGSSVGIGFNAVASQPASPTVATVDVNGTLNFPTTCAGGVIYNFPANPTCPAGNYATYRPGLETYYQTASDHTDDVSGSMWCCPWPTGAFLP